MSIKSLDELKKMRDENLKKVKLRETGKGNGQIEILVGMATCGIAAGARETLAGILEAIDEEGLENIKVVSVGCLGYCHSEPVIQVNIPGDEPVLYGKVDRKKAKEIIKKHIIGGDLLNDSILINTFNRA